MVHLQVTVQLSLRGRCDKDDDTWLTYSDTKLCSGQLFHKLEQSTNSDRSRVWDSFQKFCVLKPFIARYQRCLLPWLRQSKSGTQTFGSLWPFIGGANWLSHIQVCVFRSRPATLSQRPVKRSDLNSLKCSQGDWNRDRRGGDGDRKGGKALRGETQDQRKKAGIDGNMVRSGENWQADLKSQWPKRLVESDCWLLPFYFLCTIKNYCFLKFQLKRWKSAENVSPGAAHQYYMNRSMISSKFLQM